jgi:hypothetical protein
LLQKVSSKQRGKSEESKWKTAAGKLHITRRTIDARSFVECLNKLCSLNAAVIW